MLEDLQNIAFESSKFVSQQKERTVEPFISSKAKPNSISKEERELSTKFLEKHTMTFSKSLTRINSQTRKSSNTDTTEASERDFGLTDQTLM